ncbi:hypothetical protein TRFO_19099 [Tritrichomonas foetus]|uniref:Protein kinase domain-containing protein n=1 Tax=Tritrichomonas foetus TaxID=1144522 RepID=A0A1J4KNT4_9EUKA|nr:hypothetical protein TRFO_19099 [Tritrichomonas foetus]|eukprot:OHT11460.1 hypothetical protein TRFO_19099 [Tritrichomonas foetus]
MIKGEQYTTESDYWSAGVLLYAMVFSELPFEDSNTQRLLQKIIYSEPSFPVFISPQLRDLLNRMLTKEPSSRITLKKIKEHPWFSQASYAQLTEKILKSQKWRVSAMNALDDPVDRSIIQKMTEYGYECQSLVSSILSGEINHLTAVYRMLKKDKITDMMEEISFINQRIKIHEPKTPRFKPIPPPIPMNAKLRALRQRVNYEDSKNVDLKENAYEKIANSANLKLQPPPLPVQPTLLQSVGSSRKTVKKPVVPPLQRRKRVNSFQDGQRHSIGPM